MIFPDRLLEWNSFLFPLFLAPRFFMKGGAVPKRLVLSPATASLDKARRWLADPTGGGTDGVIAKRLDDPYAPGERQIIEVKRVRTADCVVGGFRYQSKGRQVGSLLIGLYDACGRLDHVGFTSAIVDSDRPALTKRLEKLRSPPGFTGRAPGGPSRWSMDRSGEWEPLPAGTRGGGPVRSCLRRAVSP